MSIARRVPPEIWLRVLRAATDTSNEFFEIYMLSLEANCVLCMDVHPCFLGGVLDLKSFKRRVREHATMKQSAISTCRSWYHLALPFMFEAVIISDDESLASLVDTLAKSKSNPGLYIKYFYCRKFDYLLSISKWCPNLETINVSTVSRYSLSPRLPQLSAMSTLTSFTYYGSHLGLQSDEMFRMLSSVSNIHRLELSINIVGKQSPGPRTLTFPYLHSLILRDQNTSSGENCELVAEKWCMPSLRHIYGVGELSKWPQCFDAPSVTALTYTGSFYSPSVLSACPNLNEVTFRLPDIVWMPAPTPFRRVNIFYFTLDKLHDHFVTLNNPVTYPELEIISVFNHWALKSSVVPQKSEEWIDKGEWTFWSYWHRRWQSRNVRLEDGLGTLVTLPNDTVFGRATDEDYYLWHQGTMLIGDDYDESCGSEVSYSEADESGLSYGELA